jgi:hypothetical protein
VFNGCAWAAREPQFSMTALVFYRGLFGLLVLRAAELLFSEATRAVGHGPKEGDYTKAARFRGNP